MSLRSKVRAAAARTEHPRCVTCALAPKLRAEVDALLRDGESPSSVWRALRTEYKYAYNYFTFYNHIRSQHHTEVRR